MTAQLLRSELTVLELREREANAPKRETNAPKREELRAKAVAAWGPDHASRPPTAVHNLRGPLQPTPPLEQLPDSSWKGGRRSHRRRSRRRRLRRRLRHYAPQVRACSR